MESIRTLYELVERIGKNPSNPRAFNYFYKTHWASMSNDAYVFNLKRLTYGLIELGLRRGDKVGILAESSPQWSMADFAIVIAGGITVPLFVRLSDENFIFEVAQTGMRFLFVQGKNQWIKLSLQRKLFDKIIALDDAEGVEDIIHFHTILTVGERAWERKPGLWSDLGRKLHEDNIATIIYTAGSTGTPKGVQMTHKNLLHLVESTDETFSWNGEEDTYLNILPLPHIFAKQINLIILARGIRAYYLNDWTLMARICQEIKPTLMILVPRILEKIHAAIHSHIERKKNWIIKMIFKWAFFLAMRPKRGFLTRSLFFPMANCLVYSKIRNIFGGDWHTILCGGAALDPQLCRFFQNIGIPVFEGWGLTEGSTLCVNTDKKCKIGTVGTPLPGIEIRISKEQEVLVKSPTVMKGYYRDPKATARAIDEEGWLHTGDCGSVDAEEFLTLTGRIKENFKLSTGEYISPNHIEYMLSQHPLISMAMVVGEKKKYASCLLFCDLEAVKQRKKKANMEEMTIEEFLGSEYMQKEMRKLIRKVNKRINNWEKINKYHLIAEPLSIEDGEITPTEEIKREQLLQKFKKEIDAMYAEGNARFGF